MGREDDIRYSDQWYPVTDGGGASLQAADESAVDLAVWGQPDGWRPSGMVNGTPGQAETQVSLPGDANRDGIFNSSDLVLVFAAGQYENPLNGNATWEQGDWNRDGKFTTADLVLAFVNGQYTAAASSRSASRFTSWSSGLPADDRSDRGQRPSLRIAHSSGLPGEEPTLLEVQPLRGKLAARWVDALWAEE